MLDVLRKAVYVMTMSLVCFYHKNKQIHLTVYYRIQGIFHKFIILFAETCGWKSPRGMVSSAKLSPLNSSVYKLFYDL